MLRAIPTFILLLGSHLAVSASDFSEAIPKVKKCQEAGAIAASFHGVSREKLLAESAKIDDLVRRKRMSAWRAEEAKRLFEIGFASKSEAMARASANNWCMDVL